jgi:hypothetical protein
MHERKAIHKNFQVTKLRKYRHFKNLIAFFNKEEKQRATLLQV